ncbi:MAG: MraY family glycosyltransferase [Rikenellaceae bacterium]
MDIFVIYTFILSTIIGLLTIPSIVIISKKKRLFDTPNSRKVHTNDVSRLGGVSFLPAIFFSLCAMIGIRNITGNDISPLYQLSFNTEFMFFTAGVMLLFFTGLADDLIGVGYKNKFVVQIISAFFLSISSLYIDNIGGLFGLHAISDVGGIIFTTLAIVLIVNAYNLIDGVDGLCSGLTLIAVSTFTIWFWINGLYAYAMIGCAVLGCVTVFFFYNVTGRRMKVFMGDAGSLVLGFVICYLGLKFIDMNENNMYGMSNGLVVTLSIVFIPVFDTFRVFTERIAAGHSPFHPDKTHIHHYLLALGFTHFQSTSIILIAAVVVMAANFIFANINITILFLSDILFGLVFLCFIPKYFVKRQIKINIKNKIIKEVAK